MKGFKKDGKFRPTGNRKKSSLKIKDLKGMKSSRTKPEHENYIVKPDGTYVDLNQRNKKSNDDYHQVEQENRNTHQFFRTLKGLNQDWAYMRTEENEGTIAEGTVVLYDLDDNKIAEIPTVNFLGYLQDNLLEDVR